jgi:hypothetical protein
VAEPAIRAVFRSTRNFVQLERWLIQVASCPQVPAFKQVLASRERAFVLLETALAVQDQGTFIPSFYSSFFEGEKRTNN